MSWADPGLRLLPATRPLTQRWRQEPVSPRGGAQIGISFRQLQAEALGLDAQEALDALLAHPFQLIRLGAYWNRIEPAPGAFHPAELDRQIDAAERAGKQVIVCLGPVKTFGYPEFFVPAHHLATPLPEKSLITPESHPELLEAAVAFLTRIVKRYAGRAAITAWQVEHEAVEPLGIEHSWRLAEAFVRAEIAAVRAADPDRPVMLNGFLPASLPVRLQQWWRTRDQGDSLAVAQRLADIVGIDYYPRHALVSTGPLTVYLHGGPAGPRRAGRLLDSAAQAGQQLIIAEGQAEPWEAVTVPPSPPGRAAASCRPEDVIRTYSTCLRWAAGRNRFIDGYLFWGAEYWLLRDRQGDPRYLQAFARVLDES